jgi:hypothetical protein
VAFCPQHAKQAAPANRERARICIAAQRAAQQHLTADDERGDTNIAGDNEGLRHELLFGERDGVQVSRPSSIERSEAPWRAQWIFGVPMDTRTLTALSLSGFAFCQDDVQLTAQSLPIPGPRARDELCRRPRPQTDHAPRLSLAPGVQSASVRASCATLLRRRGTVLVDACEPDLERIARMNGPSEPAVACRESSQVALSCDLGVGRIGCRGASLGHSTTSSRDVSRIREASPSGALRSDDITMAVCEAG